jgi:hypothetical protein
MVSNRSQSGKQPVCEDRAAGKCIEVLQSGTDLAALVVLLT